jgi:hypothetical protein
LFVLWLAFAAIFPLSEVSALAAKFCKKTRKKRSFARLTRFQAATYSARNPVAKSGFLWLKVVLHDGVSR